MIFMYIKSMNSTVKFIEFHIYIYEQLCKCKLTSQFLSCRILILVCLHNNVLSQLWWFHFFKGDVFPVSLTSWSGLMTLLWPTEYSRNSSWGFQKRFCLLIKGTHIQEKLVGDTSFSLLPEMTFGAIAAIWKSWWECTRTKSSLWIRLEQE